MSTQDHRTGGEHGYRSSSKVTSSAFVVHTGSVTRFTTVFGPLLSMQKTFLGRFVGGLHGNTCARSVPLRYGALLEMCSDQMTDLTCGPTPAVILHASEFSVWGLWHLREGPPHAGHTDCNSAPAGKIARTRPARKPESHYTRVVSRQDHENRPSYPPEET